MKQKILLFLGDLWNVFDVVIICLFFFGFSLRWELSLLGYARAFYALAVSLCVVRIVDMFAVSPHLGPFVHIIGVMVSESIVYILGVLYYGEELKELRSESICIGIRGMGNIG